MRSAAISILFVLILLVASRAAQAERYTSNRNGRAVVVHTRMLPVVAHRVVPPFYGRHVYEGRGRRRSPSARRGR